MSLKKITKNGRALFLAYDHGMEHGTVDFDDRSVDPEKVLAIANCGQFSGVILQKGVAEKYYNSKKYQVPLIVKLNGKTNLVDFSILLYWWGKYNPAVDLNQDGIVNLPDFSILMYYWTG